MTIQQIDSYIKENDIVVIDFYASWCGPCKMLSPILAELESEMKDVKFIKVNVDEDSEIAQQFNISSIPTLYLYKNAKLSDHISGFRSKEDLKK
jgi:thioredoxin 1